MDIIIIGDSNATPEQVVDEAVTASLAMRGCICQPDIYYWSDEFGPRTSIRHDDYCPAIH
jgi:hypothetical protein